LFETLLKNNYSFRLIKIMVMATFSGVFIENLLAPIFAVYVLYPYIEKNFLIEWFAMHLLLIILRIVSGKKILSLIKEDSYEVYFHLKINYFLSSLTAILFGVAIWMAVLSDVPEITIVTLVVIVIGLASGSIVSLGAVFTAYFIFVVLNFLMLISALLYYGHDMFSVIAFTMLIMLTALIMAGYKQSIIIKDSISMDETFKNIYEGSSDGLIISEGGRFVSCNQAILEMFKIPSMELFFRADFLKFSPKTQPDGHDSLKKMALVARKAYRDGSATTEWLHKDYYGKEFWSEIVLTRIQLKGKELLYGVWRDISQRKATSAAAIEYKKEIETLNANLESRVKEEVEKNMQKDRQLLQQSRLAQMGEMISMIAHQWRQPLAAISSTSAAIGLKSSLGKLDNDTAMQLSDKISTYVQHLSETINDFRNFFKQNREKVDTNYNEVIQSVLNISDMSLKHKNITLVQELDCDVSFLSHSNELKQVVLNLLKNAEDVFVERKSVSPQIKIKTYQKNNKVVLEMSDNGGGVDESILEKMFDPYFSTKLKKDGTGLGLYMSKIIIEEHCGGSLTCKNIENGLLCKMEIPLA